MPARCVAGSVKARDTLERLLCPLIAPALDGIVRPIASPTFSPVGKAGLAPLGRSQAVRQRILIPPCGGSNPPAPATYHIENARLFWRHGLFFEFIRKRFRSAIRKFCSRDVRITREPMCMSLTGRRKSPFHGALGVTVRSPAFVCRERSALAVG